MKVSHLLHLWCFNTGIVYYITVLVVDRVSYKCSSVCYLMRWVARVVVSQYVSLQRIHFEHSSMVKGRITNSRLSWLVRYSLGLIGVTLCDVCHRFHGKWGTFLLRKEVSLTPIRPTSGIFWNLEHCISKPDWTNMVAVTDTAAAAKTALANLKWLLKNMLVPRTCSLTCYELGWERISLSFNQRFCEWCVLCDVYLCALCRHTWTPFCRRAMLDVFLSAMRYSVKMYSYLYIVSGQQHVIPFCKGFCSRQHGLDGL